MAVVEAHYTCIVIKYFDEPMIAIGEQALSHAVGRAFDIGFEQRGNGFSFSRFAVVIVDDGIKLLSKHTR